MRVIIAGSRTITDYNVVVEAIKESGYKITEIVSGHASGVDSLGERYAAENDIPLKTFPAQWYRFGKKAGFLRNAEMARYAHGLVAIWDGESKGTKSMISLMKDKQYFIKTIKEEETDGRRTED